MNIFENNNILYNIISYLNINNINNLILVSLYFYNNKIIDNYWKDICIKIWLQRKEKINDRLCLKRNGIYSWKYTYKVWKYEMKIPYGKYMPIIQYCYGKIKYNFINSWLYLQHTPDGILLPYQENSNVSIGNIRICLQNYQDNSIYINIKNSFEVHIKSQKDNQFETIPILNCTLNSFNGLAISKTIDDKSVNNLSDIIKLDQYEFAVFTLNVICPEGVHHEVDLLSSLKNISILISKTLDVFEKTNISNESKESIESQDIDQLISNDNTFHINIPVYDEDIIWNSYEMTPGGVILLKDINKMVSDR